jgi:SPP1 family predicted phage head-tail adaptor
MTAPLQATDLRQRITLEQPSETAGDAVVSWTVKATAWAEIRTLSGLERSGIAAEATHRVRLRFRSDLAINPRWRLGLGSTRKLNIVSVFDPDGRQREFVLMAQEVV